MGVPVVPEVIVPLMVPVPVAVRLTLPVTLRALFRVMLAVATLKAPLMLPPLSVVVPVPAVCVTLPLAPEVVTVPLNVTLFALAMVRPARGVVAPMLPVKLMLPVVLPVVSAFSVRVLPPSAVLANVMLPPLVSTVELPLSVAGLLTATLPPVDATVLSRSVPALVGAGSGAQGDIAGSRDAPVDANGVEERARVVHIHVLAADSERRAELTVPLDSTHTPPAPTPVPLLPALRVMLPLLVASLR